MVYCFMNVHEEKGTEVGGKNYGIDYMSGMQQRDI